VQTHTTEDAFVNEVTRTADGTEVPAPGSWAIDPVHAHVGFVGRHFGLSRVRGRFTGVDGAVHIAEDLADSRIEVTIDMATVDSGSPDRDEHLRSADLFDVERHPTATFRSTRIETAGSIGKVTGDLSIKGVTRPVTLEVEYLGHARDPWDNDRAVFSAAASINREDWDISWNMVLDAGGLLVSKEIKLEIEVELVRQ
jgi:polyisoprenoid-binding protein YceI